MNCGYPIQLTKELSVSCRQCMNCRINSKRMWTGRILLENQYSARQGSFVTLTYSPENLPDGHIRPGGTLEPQDTTKWLKRLRKALSPFPVRYFLVGEYGEKSERAHYHAILFNLDPLTAQPVVDKTWGLGHTKTGSVTRASAQYVAHYTTKKLTHVDDLSLMGRYPEFARMSKAPPLGEPGARYLLDLYTSGPGSAAIAEYGDIAANMRLDGKVYPISRYWRDWLRDYLDIPEENRNSEYTITLEEQQNAQAKADKLWTTRHRRTTQSSI